MKYRFIGRDSLGYKHGRIYDIRVMQPADWYHPLTKVAGNSPLAIVRIRPWFIELFFGNGYCPYQTVEAFVANWQVIIGEDIPL